MEQPSFFTDLLQGRVLIVDDLQANVTLLQRILAVHGFSNVYGETNSRAALAALPRIKPDLVLLDLHMPSLDGFGFLQAFRAWVPAGEFLPVMMLTADATADTRNRALKAGARDFLHKPFDAGEVVLRCRNLLDMRRLYREVARQNETLEEKVRARTQDLEDAQAELIQRVALVGDLRDDATGHHARRVGHAARLTAKYLGMPEAEVTLIGLAAPLHDIGKIGIRDAIIQKASPLTAEEFDEVKTHATLGARILGGSKFEVLRAASEIARTHHERWDGSGYFGMRGHEVSAMARIVAVADVFDALAHWRPYKDAWPEAEAVAEIRAGRGTLFDPEMTDAFLAVQREHHLIERPGEARDEAPGAL